MQTIFIWGCKINTSRFEWVYNREKFARCWGCNLRNIGSILQNDEVERQGHANICENRATYLPFHLSALAVKGPDFLESGDSLQLKTPFRTAKKCKGVHLEVTVTILAQHIYVLADKCDHATECLYHTLDQCISLHSELFRTQRCQS